MICHILQYGGCMLMILCLLISTSSSSEKENTLTIQEFCSGNFYIHNIEPGDSYILTLKSERVPQSKWYQKSKRKCRQEFKTSSSAAHFKVAISNMSIPSCDDNCRCNYFEIAAPSGFRKRYCGIKEADYFASKSDKISIDFHHGSTLRFDVTLTFTVERNVFIITGTPSETSLSSSFVETPYFPHSYPPDYKAEYILQSNDQSSHVLLLFLDFQISYHSFIEVTGNNGTHPTRFYGDVFRPPVIISQSPRLTLKFQSSDDQTGLAGFRAICSFIKNTDSLIVPNTNCGGSKDGKGGLITIENHEGFRLHDCVWHILPFFPLTKSNLSVTINLQNVGHKSILEFRRGRNSKSEIIKEINCESEDCKIHSEEIIVPASEYLYIRFSGYLESHSVINMTYITYHTGNCSDQEFSCANGRCLLSDFQCDGVEHCPDGSDEELCPLAEISKDEKYSPTNVRSENLQSYASHTEMYVIVIFGCFALCTFIITVITFIYKYCRNRTLSPILPQTTPRDLPDVQHNMYPANPRNCDELPSYEDFIKSSECYPPLLYTRAKECIFPKNSCTSCTTSFCSSSRMRHHSADSFPSRNSDTDSGDIFLNVPREVQCSVQASNSRCNVEIIQSNPAFKPSTNTVKRSHSLDSKLNDMYKQGCHVSLSIVHPVCSHALNHSPHVQWHTLPHNFKMKAFNDKVKSTMTENDPCSIRLDSRVNFMKDRSFTWSFVPHSAGQSELVTVVKTRCFSEPCREISIHCSLT